MRYLLNYNELYEDGFWITRKEWINFIWNAIPVYLMQYAQDASAYTILIHIAWYTILKHVWKCSEISQVGWSTFYCIANVYWKSLILSQDIRFMLNYNEQIADIFWITSKEWINVIWSDDHILLCNMWGKVKYKWY